MTALIQRENTFMLEWKGASTETTTSEAGEARSDLMMSYDFSLFNLQDTGHPSERAFNAQAQGRGGEMNERKPLKQDPFPTPLRCYIPLVNLLSPLESLSSSRKWVQQS